MSDSCFFKHSKDQFACHGCPGAVLNDCHLTILVITLGQTFDKTAHAGEKVSIISNTRQHQSVITESIGNSFCLIASCQIIQYCFLSFFLQNIREVFCSISGIAVDRSIGNHHSGFFRLIRRPLIIFFQIESQILLKYRTVKRANGLNVQSCRFFRTACTCGPYFPTMPI